MHVNNQKSELCDPEILLLYNCNMSIYLGNSLMIYSIQTIYLVPPTAWYLARYTFTCTYVSLKDYQLSSGHITFYVL